MRVSRDLIAGVVSSGRSDLTDLQELQRATVEGWHLVHHPETLEPVYGLVPIRAESGRLLGLIALDAAGERWLWYRFTPAGMGADDRASAVSDFPAVSAREAGERVERRSRAAGTDRPTEQPLLIEGTDKHLYWQFQSAQGEKWLVNADRTGASVLEPGDDAAARVLPPSPTLAEQRNRCRRASEGTPAPGESQRSGSRLLPSAYRMPGVPYHYQITSWYCGPASLHMVMDHWGQEIPQVPISDVANDIVNSGCYADDMDRSAHFSGMSAAIQDPTLIGYAERKLGYACVEYSWGSHPDRYGALRSLACSHYPLFVLTWFSSAHGAGHYRVVTGYDDNLDVFIMQDPWYSGTYTGPDLLVNQTVFVEDWWEYSWCWGMVASPWLLHPEIPSTIALGDTFSVDLTVLYPGPLPELQNRDLCTSCVATIELPMGLSLAGGTATQPLTNMRSGDSTIVSWEVVADGPAGDFGIYFQAQGLVTGSCTSYPSYTDSIGGHGYDIATVG
ncbi:MAG: C39 family peptidase, partial [Candidatus Bipolaricaulota bacterium]